MMKLMFPDGSDFVVTRATKDTDYREGETTLNFGVPNDVPASAYENADYSLFDLVRDDADPVHFEGYELANASQVFWGSDNGTNVSVAKRLN